MRALQLLIAATGLVLGVVAYRVQVDNLGGWTTSTRAAAIVAVAWSFLVAGLIAWSRRPGNRLGPLLAAAGIFLLLRQLRYSHDELVFTVFFLLSEVSYALAAHSVLAYPSGEVTGRAERALVRVGYAATLFFPLAILLVYDGSEQLRYMSGTPDSMLMVWEDGELAVALQKAFVVFVWGILASLFIALIVRRLVRATPRTRRLLAPLVLAAVVFALRAVWEGVFTFVERPSGIAYDYLLWWQIVGFIALPIALLAGMLRARLARANVGDLVLELERTPPEDLPAALARTLGDPDLEVLFWLPERGEYVDTQGRRAELPAPGADRAVTLLDHDEDEPVAAIVHDASLVDEPELLRASGAAAGLALENARLHAEMRAQLVQVQESRVRIVAAADEERRRIERDIHDGAQQRLVALALQLRSAQRQLGNRSDPEIDRLLAEAVGELQVAVEELRELARGVHPAILTEDGLGAALESLAGRTPLPVELDVTDGRLPPQIEATAYFVACEALANVVKHAHASRAAVSARQRNGLLVVEIEDDGVGGARAANGSGLSGLADRVEALGGRLLVESPAGAGTRVVGEIPCAS
jgi:signal transduction histidine kinase